MEEIIKLAREMGVAIQNTALYKELNAAREACDNDEELQDRIDKFTKLGELMEKRTEAKADEKEIEEINERMMGVYGGIMSNPNMSKFYAAKDTVDMSMNKVVAILSAALDGADPMTYEPEEHDHSCDGDCCSCGGCH